MHNKVKSCKPDVMKTYNHHGSHGSCFSFYNKQLYGMADKKSVVLYSNKRSKNELQKNVIVRSAIDMAKKIFEAIVQGIGSLILVIPDIRYILSPILDTANRIKKS